MTARRNARSRQMPIRFFTSSAEQFEDTPWLRVTLGDTRVSSDAVLIAITDPEDERIAAFRNVRDRDLLREHEGAFAVEGEVVLRVLVGQSRRPARAVLVSEAQAARMDEVLVRLPGSTPVYVAPQGIVEAIVGFPMHR